ncbi:PspC domain-containing protein [Cohnella sp. CFH 77786]|uniref:PspC domain-containing protein n=1 Tax=Cohnella sp. CFH 77786 TaxID=2662265 RepID=UPI001C60DF2A|nr:PspC domain-containing protein [Cohnella sp. CFH 77786]MBW5449434.1 PspC domain-containing protein [Cohnella sp. CFH 77786]
MRKLYRSSRDKKIFGVCGGLADYLGVDATLLRILLVVVTFFSAGSVILVYILAGFIIPREYPGGFGTGPAPYSHGWGHGTAEANHPPQYGTQGWPPGNSWQNASVPPTPPPSPARPSQAFVPPQAAPKAQGLDAMMEDIEKKALRREIEELKAKITKIEKDSKGE